MHGPRQHRGGHHRHLADLNHKRLARLQPDGMGRDRVLDHVYRWVSCACESTTSCWCFSRDDHYLVEVQWCVWPKASYSCHVVNLHPVFWSLWCYANDDTAVRDNQRWQIGVYSGLISRRIICRVFQGIGAAGCFSLALVIAYEMVPKEKYPAQAAQLAASTALGSLVGPLIGGAISQDTTWRWVFLLKSVAISSKSGFRLIIVQCPSWGIDRHSTLHQHTEKFPSSW